MAKINILAIEICHKRKLIDEQFLFASENARDVRLKFGEISCKRDKKKEKPLISVRFEEMGNGKGLIKSMWNTKSFMMELNDLGDVCYLNLLHVKTGPNETVSVNLDGYAMSMFLQCLTCSQKYVELVANYLSHKCHESLSCSLNFEGMKLGLYRLKIQLEEPKRHVLDLKWAKMACTTMHELRQLQYAMSWLSTLGGAYSALGEEQERCAELAGMISIEQLRLALRLGDKIVIAQCKLFFSLSLIQRGYCQLAKKLIKEQYDNIKSSPVVDRRTLNMCKGIWARLRYAMQIRRVKRPKLSHRASLTRRMKSSNVHQ